MVVPKFEQCFLRAIFGHFTFAKKKKKAEFFGNYTKHYFFQVSYLLNEGTTIDWRLALFFNVVFMNQNFNLILEPWYH